MSFWTEGLPVVTAALAASAAVCAGAVVASKLLNVDGLLARLTTRGRSPEVLIDELAGLADLARREGLLSLERRAQELREPLLSAGIGMVVEGVPAAQISEAIQAESFARAAGGPWRLRIVAWLTVHPQVFAGVAAATLLGIFLSSRGELTQTGEAAAAAGLGVLLVGIISMAVTGSPQRSDAGVVAGRVLAGLLLARGIAMIQRGADGREVRAQLEAMLPHAQRTQAARARAA